MAVKIIKTHWCVKKNKITLTLSFQMKKKKKSWVKLILVIINEKKNNINENTTNSEDISSKKAIR